ncbi:hypothetical protein MMC12_001898 [Toensbergia leucococca]|nr:hypothetical protein [Toensbergia leucococca]
MAATNPAHQSLRLLTRKYECSYIAKAAFPTSTVRHIRNEPARECPHKSLQTAPLSNSIFSYHLPKRRLSGIYTSQLQQRRCFAASSSARAVAVTANPRKDENGNDMLIDITSRAAIRLHEIMSKDSNPSLALRVTVESGGCHGFQYLMSLTNTSAVSTEEDTIFEASDGTGAKVVMDEPSLELLKGSKIDYTMELIGSQFKIVGNPAATSSCGCGTSFDIKS